MGVSVISGIQDNHFVEPWLCQDIEMWGMRGDPMVLEYVMAQ